MTSEDPPLTEEELSEFEKEFFEKKDKTSEKLNKEELEQAIKDFIEKKKSEKKEDTKSEVKEETIQNAKTSENFPFIDLNRFVESMEGSRLEKNDVNERTFIADNIEQRVSSGQSFLPQLFQRPDNKRDEDREDFSYSSREYNNSEEKKYTTENDVESHLVGSPRRPEGVDIAQVGKENPLRQQFDNQPDFKSPYPEQINSGQEKDYIPKTNIDPEQAGRDKSSFFEREFGKKSDKYETK